MTHINSIAATPATFTHSTVSYQHWRSEFVKTDVRGLRLRGGYHHVEYMSAPQGLIVLAHQNDVAGQVDGIHPVSLSTFVDDDRNIIEPFIEEGSGYAVHYLNRKQQGGLVLGAYGRMVDGGDPEAPAFFVESGELVLEMISSKAGPIVAVVEGTKTAHVIQPLNVVTLADRSGRTVGTKPGRAEL